MTTQSEASRAPRWSLSQCIGGVLPLRDFTRQGGHWGLPWHVQNGSVAKTRSAPLATLRRTDHRRVVIVADYPVYIERTDGPNLLNDGFGFLKRRSTVEAKRSMTRRSTNTRECAIVTLDTAISICERHTTHNVQIKNNVPLEPTFWWYREEVELNTTHSNSSAICFN